jgi:hypothetical protein
VLNVKESIPEHVENRIGPTAQFVLAIWYVRGSV